MTDPRFQLTADRGVVGAQHNNTFNTRYALYGMLGTLLAGSELHVMSLSGPTWCSDLTSEPL